MNVNEQDLEVIMKLIMYSGDAKGLAMKAIRAAKKGQLELADENLQEAHQSLLQAHHVQTELLTHEAAGQEMNINLLTIHSQDHLMNAITFIDLAKELIDIYRQK